MVSFWGMDPIKTSNRHFFLIENFDGDFNEISNTLVSKGFQKGLKSEELFISGDGQIQFIQNPDHKDSQYFGGIIAPNESKKIGAKRYLNRLSFVGKLSMLLIIAYTLQWGVAFLAHFANLPWLMAILELTIPFAILFSIIAGALFVLFGFSFDIRSSQQNQKIMKNLIDPLIEALQSVVPELEIKRISFDTSIMDRHVKKRLPSEFSEKIQALGIKQINAFYWT